MNAGCDKNARDHLIRWYRSCVLSRPDTCDTTAVRLGDVTRQVVESAARSAAPPLRDWVRGYVGTRLDGFTAGHHRALPSASVAVVVALDGPIEIDGMGSFHALAAGLGERALEVRHAGSSFDMAVGMDPLGAKAVLGVPSRAIAGHVVDLADLWGTGAGELVDRLATARSWASRFAILDTMLSERARDADRSPDALGHAWRRLLGANGSISVADLAESVGYSRRQLHQRFVSDYGVTPKRAARIARFQHSARLLRTRERRPRKAGLPNLAEIAVAAGFYDQAHMAREWNDLAGCPPSVWLSEEVLPFVQASEAADRG
jgi:AraC-like DNA-binding protein